MKYLWLALLSLSTTFHHATAGFSTCNVIIPLESTSTLLSPHYLKNEIAASPIFMLPGKRFAVGTMQTEGGSIIGGRLLIQDLETNEIKVGLETPSITGEPSLLREITLSPNGNYIAATGGYLSGGPVLMYDSQALKLLHSEPEYRHEYDRFVANFLQTIRLAMGGDPRYQDFWRDLNKGEAIEKLYTENRPLLIRSLIHKFEQSIGRRSQSDMIPAISVQFHPKSESYLVNTGSHVSIRNSATGAEESRIFLDSDLAPEQLDPPSVYYLGYGNFLCAISRKYLTLWDAKDGAFLSALEAPGNIIETNPRFITASPFGDYIAVAYEIEGIAYEVLYTQGIEGPKNRPVLKEVMRYPATAIAFSEKIWVAANHPGAGVIRVRSSIDLEKIWEFRFTGSYEGGPIAVSADGDAIAVAGINDGEAAVELWIPSVGAGKQFQMTSPKGIKARITNLTFSPDSNWLTVTVQEQPLIGKAMPKVKAYVIDVLRNKRMPAGKKG